MGAQSIDDLVIEQMIITSTEYFEVEPETTELNDKIGYVFFPNQEKLYLITRHAQLISELMYSQGYGIKKQEYSNKNNTKIINIIYSKNKKDEISIDFFHEKDGKKNYFIMEIKK